MRKYQIKSNNSSAWYIAGACLLFFFCSVLNTAIAQHLSPAGHILLPEQEQLQYEVQKQSSEISYQHKTFKGNTLLKTGSGFLSIHANYENAPSQLFFYNAKGELLFQKQFEQTINLCFSENKNYIAFYNRGFIHTLHIPTQQETRTAGSTLFCVNNNGELSHVNTNRSLIYVDGNTLQAPSMITQLMYTQNSWYYLTKNTIYKYEDAALLPLFTLTDAVLFDVKIFKDEWYISTRTKSNTRYNFVLLHTSNLNSFQTLEEKEYKRAYSAPPQEQNKDSKFNNRTNELIQNPMDFMSAESYQAIGNSYNEIQEYSPNSTYLHPGVDLFGEHLENVHSVKSGYVKAILTTSGDYHWRVAIANDNGTDSSQGYLYAHLDQTLIPVLVGDTVAEGEVIGQLVDFPVQGFVHCHFARIVDQGTTWSGSWWTFDDPLYYMTNFRDTTAPVFEEAIAGQKFAFRDDIGDYLSSDNVYGSVDIISKVYDLMNTFWQVDVHKIGYQISPVLHRDSFIVDQLSFDFDMFNDTYFNGPYIQEIINTMYSRDGTCFSTGNYDDRIFYHILTNSNADDTITTDDVASAFNTTLYPNGDYVLRVWATDPAGNTSMDSMVFTIDNFVGISNQQKNKVQVYPNPCKGVLHLKNNSGKYNLIYLTDIQGRVLKTFETQGLYTHIDVQEFQNGIYVLKFDSGETTKFILNQ